MKSNAHPFRLIAWIIGVLVGDLTIADAGTTFSYSLTHSAKTSAGVYSNGVLLRTLWFDVPRNAGVNAGEWDNLDDDGHPVAPGDYEIRVLVHNMQYKWDGLVGNSSAEMTGTTVHKGMYPLQDMAITGTKAFYTTGYNEAHYPFGRFDTGNPQVRLNSWAWVVDTRSPGSRPLLNDNSCPGFAFATTDGTHVYFASASGWESMTSWKPTGGYIVANRVSDDGQPDDVFAKGIALPDPCTPPYAYPHGIRVGTQRGLTGLAVQQTGKLLAVAVAPDNRIYHYPNEAVAAEAAPDHRIYLVDKLSGDVLSSFAVPSPKRIAFDAGSNLWIAAGTNVYCYRIQSSAPYTATLVRTIAGFANALAVAPSPTEDLIVVADGGTSMQVKGFTTSGTTRWTYGQAGGYQRNGPAVTDDKFWFQITPNAALVQSREDTFVTFVPDGTFWVGDAMNARTMHLTTAARKPRVIDRLSMQPMSYNVAVDQNNPSRVFRNFLEFKVDYRKPLGPSNGSWTLVRNWAGGLLVCYSTTPDSSTAGFSGVATLANGRTYAQIYRNETNATGAVLFQDYEIVELTATGVRSTGQMGGGALGRDALYRNQLGYSNGSFESGDRVGWQVFAYGAPTSWSATTTNTPDTATDGRYYLRLQETGPAGGGGVNLVLHKGFTGNAFRRGHTFTLSFDLQNKTNGFDAVAIKLLSVDSKGGVPTSVSASPPPVLQQDGRWHSYTAVMTMPQVPTEHHLEMQMVFFRSGAASNVTYETNLDNFKLTQESGNVLVGKGNQYWDRTSLTGFDGKGNPQWSAYTNLVTTYDLPGSSNPSAGFSQMTANGTAVCYEPTLRNIRHLGGIRTGATNWAWTGFPSTNTNHSTTRSYPIGFYDLGNLVVSGGTVTLVSDRHIIAGYNGEGWHGGQASQFMHFYEDGLFIGQFGTPGTDDKGRKWPKDYSKAGYAGNATSPALANDKGELYLYINDEWGAPLQRFHLVGAKDIRELSGTGALGGTIKLSPLKTK